MTIKNQADLLASINLDVANNNAGLISAEDIRTNMVDTVDSISAVVSSGDTDVTFPFFNDVRASNIDGNGWFIAESGVSFPNSPRAIEQYEAYPGPYGINHDDLGNRHANDDAHTQYLLTNGTRAMIENLPMGNNWINSAGEGTDDEGLKFVGSDIHVGGSGRFVFSDNSSINTGRSVAKAWLNFDGSGIGQNGVPVVRSFHNIESVQYLDTGKYKITIPSGVLKNEDFVAVGNSNARTTAASKEDFARNTVGITQRAIFNGAVTLTYLVLNEAGEYVDAEINDLVVYGYDETETAQAAPTIIPKA